MLEVGDVSSPRTATTTAPAAAAAAAPEADHRAAEETAGNLDENTTHTTTTSTISASNHNDATSLNGADTGNSNSNSNSNNDIGQNSNNANNNNNNDSADSSLNNNTSNSGNRAPVAKDKHCIYCHMAFTSSALGRHYDQFLFKKKPDGVHNVEEIRQMRSNITRRTARTSSAAAELAKQEPGFSNASVSDTGSVRSLRPGQSLPPASTGGADNYTPIGDYRHSVSRSGVGAYQVYCNPPPYTSPVVNSNSPGPSKAALADPHGKANTMRAMELALREVLDTIKAATSRVRARVLPFDFELRSQTFPSLCLHSLPPPDTIFTPSPFPSDKSFTIHPPTAALKEIIQLSLRAKVDQWREEQLASLNSPKSKSAPFNANKLRAETDLVERQARQHEEMILKHLDLSLKHWETLSPEQQRDQWHLEIMRALAHETQKRHDLEERLNRAHQESDQLRAQLEKMSSYHFPREFAFFPPDLTPISTSIARELKVGSDGQAADPLRWDYEALLSKWKRVVLHDRAYGLVSSLPVNQMPPSAPSPVPVPSSSVPGSIASPAYNNGPFADSGFTFNHSNGFGTPIHQNQAAPPERFTQYPTPEPAPKRRRISSAAGPINHPADLLTNAQTPQPSQPQQPVLPTFQQTAMGPPSVNDLVSRNRKPPPNQQYRFKYTSGPNTPKASSLHSPPAQTSTFTPASSNQFFAPAPAPPGPANVGPHPPTASPSISSSHQFQPSSNMYGSNNSSENSDNTPAVIGAPTSGVHTGHVNNLSRPFSPHAITAQQHQQHHQQPQTAPIENVPDMNFDGACSSLPHPNREDSGGNSGSVPSSRPPERDESPVASHAPSMTPPVRKADITS